MPYCLGRVTRSLSQAVGISVRGVVTAFIKLTHHSRSGSNRNVYQYPCTVRLDLPHWLGKMHFISVTILHMPLISYIVIEVWCIAPSMEPDQELIRSTSCPNLVSLQDPIRLGKLQLTALMRARSRLGWFLGRMSHE